MSQWRWSVVGSIWAYDAEALSYSWYPMEAWVSKHILLKYVNIEHWSEQNHFFPCVHIGSYVNHSESIVILNSVFASFESESEYESIPLTPENRHETPYLQLYLFTCNDIEFYRAKIRPILMMLREEAQYVQKKRWIPPLPYSVYPCLVVVLKPHRGWFLVCVYIYITTSDRSDIWCMLPVHSRAWLPLYERLALLLVF